MKVSKLKVVIISGILLRFALWCFQVEPAGDDGLRYLTETINLVDHGVFSTDMNVLSPNVPKPDAHDLPLWPSTMAVFYKMSHSVKFTQYASVLLNVGLMCVSVWFLCSLLKSKPFECGDGSCAIGCAVYLFMPDSVIYSLYHMPDMMAVCFVTVGVWAYFRYCTSGKISYVFTYGVSFGLAILAKPICIPLFAALTIALPFAAKASVVHKILASVMAFFLVGVMLAPWVARNKATFGTAGLTTISGTNLYACNWGRLVGRLPPDESSKCKADMKRFEQGLTGLDKMLSSKKMGEYAKSQILSHLPQYAVYTAIVHPRLYCGTGTVALMRYLGLNAVCYALDDAWGSGDHAPQEKRATYTMIHKVVGFSVQILSWLVLLAGYVLVVLGVIKSFKKCCLSRDWRTRLLYLCPILCIILLALVIGPITATRYRFIMILFFAILASQSCKMKVNEES